MQDWTSAFDGIMIEDPENQEPPVDMGESLRDETKGDIPYDIECLLRPIAQRIALLSEAVVEAGSGWVVDPAAPSDTGVATADFNFVAIPIGDDSGRVSCVYGPYATPEEAAEVASQLSTDPDECQSVPVIPWEN